MQANYFKARSDLGVPALLAMSGKGLCFFGYTNDESILKRYFKNAEFSQNLNLANILSAIESGNYTGSLDFIGTAFQQKVWAALCNIPKGRVCTYQDIAHSIGMPKASRAVGNAIAKNPVSLIVPCHRVIPKAGGVGHYAWGSEIKKRLLNREGAL